jgi:Lipase maturation factor
MLTIDGPWVFCLCLAATNFAALNSWRLQWPALISSKGLTPAEKLVGSWPETKTDLGFSFHVLMSRKLLQDFLLALWKKIDRHRSLFAFTGASDKAIQGVFALGFLGIAMIASSYSVLPAFGAFFYYVSYSSMHSVAKTWLRLQMDTALPECNLIFAVLYLFSWASPSAWVVAQRFLVFRVMLGCGAAKWTGGDSSWRNAFKEGRKTAMHWHHWTQPLPNALARFVHFRSDFYHSLETLGTFIFEGPLPLLYFVPSPTMRQLSLFLTTGFMLGGIALTGNYGHLHLVTITEAVAVAIEMGCGPYSSALKGNSLFSLMLFENRCPTSSSLLFTAIQWLFALVAWTIALSYIVLSCPPLFRTFEGLIEIHEAVPGWDLVEEWSSRLSRFELFHYASKFTHMTKQRLELVIEVALERSEKEGEIRRQWYQLETNVKPGGGTASLSRSPPAMNPLWHARDLFEWHQFFLTNAAFRCVNRGLPLAAVAEEWYLEGLKQLLLGNPVVWKQLVKMPKALQKEVAAILGHEPQDDSELQNALRSHVVAVRASLYHYEFTPYEKPAAALQSSEETKKAELIPSSSSSQQQPSSPTKAKRGASPAPAKAHRPPPGMEPLAAPSSSTAEAAAAPTSSKALSTVVDDEDSVSKDGVFPGHEVGAVWTRRRCCTYAVYAQKGIKLQASEVRGFSVSAGAVGLSGNLFPRADPILLVEDKRPREEEKEKEEQASGQHGGQMKEAARGSEVESEEESDD